MKRLKRVFGSVKSLTKDEYGGSTSSVLSRLTNTKSVASKSSLDRNEFNSRDGSYMGYDFQSSPLHGSHLIDYTDPINFSDNSSNKLHKYCFLGDVNKVRKFLKKVNINSQDSEGRTPLHLAAAVGHLEVVMLLMGERVNPEIEDYDGRTAFLIAVERNQIEIVQIFLNYKVDILTKDKYGNQATHLAARTGAKDVMELLIDAGLDVNAVNVLDQAPLHIATENLNLDVVKSLLSGKSNVNAQDKESVTALMLAAKTGSKQLVESLLEGGADLHLIDSSGWNAAAYAKYSMHEKLENKLTLLMSSDVRQAKQEGETHSLDRISTKHVRSISDTYDSWTDSSMTESQKLKLTYFNSEIGSSSAKTLPRQKLSNSSLGPPKPPRLYTSTPNLDMNEQDVKSENPKSSRRSRGNMESSSGNTIKSDITFGNDDNSLLDLSLQSLKHDSVSGKHSKDMDRQSKIIPLRSHSLSPKSSVSERNVVSDNKTDCDNSVLDCNIEHVSCDDKSASFSNKDKLNEIEEVWESNAHLSFGSPAHLSREIQAAETNASVEEQANAMDVCSPVGHYNENYSPETSIDLDANVIHHSPAVSSISLESPRKSEEVKSEESNLNILLTASTPTGRDELQGLVRKLRSALNEVSVNSKTKDHNLASLRKSESFLKRQLKEIEKKTSELAVQNTDFMYKLENLQGRTSALRDEANSECSSLEETNRRYLDAKHVSPIAKAATIADALSASGEIKGPTSLLKCSTTDNNKKSVAEKAPFSSMAVPRKGSNVGNSLHEELPMGSLASQILPVISPYVKHIDRIEVSAQTEIVEKTVTITAETQTVTGGCKGTCSQATNTDSGLMLNRKEESSREENLMKIFNWAMKEWKVAFEESFATVKKSMVDSSSCNKLIHEINDRLDQLNEQVPHYGDDVKAAVQSSLHFNDDLYKRISKIEESCVSLPELKTITDILKSRDHEFESILSNYKHMKLELGESLSRLETSVKANNSLTQKLSGKSDDKIAHHMETVGAKIESIEGSFDLMQNTLSEKVLMFCNVSDEIKEVSCGMRRISDNYGNISDSANDHGTSEIVAFGPKFQGMCTNIDESLVSFGTALEKLKKDLDIKLNSCTELPSNNDQTIHLLSEISDNFYDLNFKISQILQNQTYLSEPPQFERFEKLLFSNEKAAEDVKQSVHYVYNLIKSLEKKTEEKFEIIDKNGSANSSDNGRHAIAASEFSVDKISTRNISVQTEVEFKLNDDDDIIHHLEDENRLLVAENELLQKNISINRHSMQPSISLSEPTKYNDLLNDQVRSEEDLKSLKKVNRELIGKVSSLETDCDEMEEELELRNKELENQKKINVIQKKELREMRHQVAFIACLQNEKFAFEEQAIRFQHLELEYKQIIEQLQSKILDLTRKNVEIAAKINLGECDSLLNDQVDSGNQKSDLVFSHMQTADKSSDMDSLFAHIDSHFQTLVSKKLKELNEMLEERLPQGHHVTEPESVKTYQAEMVKLQREIISMKEDIDRVDCDKDLWHAKYDELHERYQRLQMNQPVAKAVEDDDSFKTALENIEEQLKVTYPVSTFVESGHPDSDYFSSLRYSTNSGSSSLEPRQTERTFLSILRPNYGQVEDHKLAIGQTVHTVPLFGTSRSENKPAGCNVETSSGSSLDQSCERYVDFLQIKHSV